MLVVCDELSAILLSVENSSLLVGLAELSDVLIVGKILVG